VARFVGHMNLWPAVAEAPGRARVGALTLRHRPAGSVKAGDAVTIGIRPEEVRVGAAARDGDNRLIARVTSVLFQGASTRLALTALGDGALALECDVAATALADLGVKEGAEVPVALAPDALRAFTETPGA
jgi:ABC-type Fe3+/spermidine/putrescine transport system ATPase subunit